MRPNWQPSRDYRSRPVAILGAGVLGRRVGTYSMLLCCQLNADTS
jgi:hypothetical protein